MKKEKRKEKGKGKEGIKGIQFVYSGGMPYGLYCVYVYESKEAWIWNITNIQGGERERENIVFQNFNL